MPKEGLILKKIINFLNYLREELIFIMQRLN